MVERINKRITEIKLEPFAGVEKPEALKHALSGFWSRRITDGHRVVYRLEGGALVIAQLRFHYQDAQPFAPTQAAGTNLTYSAPS